MFFLVFGVKCGVGAAVALGGTTIALPAIGFGSAGIVAGTIAAGVQSSIGNVVAGTMFASLQSAGVVGLATGTKAIIGAAGAAVTAML